MAVRLNVLVDEVVWRRLRDLAEECRAGRGRTSVSGVAAALLKEGVERHLATKAQ